MMKDREVLLLEAISEDELATQASLSGRLGIAVGSVNWYIKRLISRGYLKVTRMDRTRLRYNMTSEGLAVLRRRASQYMKDSLKVYQQLREDSLELITRLRLRDIQSVRLEGNDAALDIFRLSCLEENYPIDQVSGAWSVTVVDGAYRLKETSEANGKR